MRLSHSLAIGCLFAAVCVAATAQTAFPAAPFTAIALHGGGEIVVRAGATQRVTLLKGSTRYTHFAAVDGRLAVDNCPSDCPSGYDLKIEIVAPVIAMLSVTDGGSIQAAGEFPAQDFLRAAVNQGGTIDVRAMNAAAVNASVAQGGRIFVISKTSLTAHVSHGGHITYWGGTRVERAVSDGGAVDIGSAQDRKKPLSELAPRLPSLPAIPPLQDLNTLH